MNTNKQSYINRLNRGDKFTFLGQSTVYTCQYQRSEGGLTEIHYSLPSEPHYAFSFVKAGLTTISMVA